MYLGKPLPYHNRAPDNTFFTTCHSLHWRWPGRKFCLVLSVGLQFSLYFGAEKHFSSELLFCKRLQSLIYYRGKLLCFLLNTELQNLSSLKMCVHIAHQQEEAGRMCRYLSIPALGKVIPKGIRIKFF